jgi:hypothetical protein
MLAKTRSDCTVRDTMRNVAKRETRIRLLRYSFGPDRAIADRRTQIVKRKSLSPILHQLMAWSIATLPVSRGPVTTTRVGFEVDGIEVKVREDFAAAFVEWRSWYRNPGA